MNESDWIVRLRHEVLMSPMKSNFTFTRDEVIELLGGLFAQGDALARDDLAVRIRHVLPVIRALTGVPLFDAGTHDACEKIEALL
jgi:hypothetical protein